MAGRRDFGLPEETVDGPKRARLHRAGFAIRDLGRLPGLLARHGTLRANVRLPILRFDLSSSSLATVCVTTTTPSSRRSGACVGWQATPLARTGERSDEGTHGRSRCNPRVFRRAARPASGFARNASKATFRVSWRARRGSLRWTVTLGVARTSIRTAPSACQRSI